MSLPFTTSHAEAVASARREHFDHLEALGVPRETLWLGPAAFGFSTIEIDGEHYRPDASGFPAVIVPVSEIENGLLTGVVDLVAWRTSDPGKWWIRRGIAPVLGKESIERAAHYGEPLALHASPLDWLRANRQGAVVLNWNCCLGFWLGGIDQIYTSLETAERLDSAFKATRRLPEIFVKEERHAA